MSWLEQTDGEEVFCKMKLNRLDNQVFQSLGTHLPYLGLQGVEEREPVPHASTGACCLLLFEETEGGQGLKLRKQFLGCLWKYS